MRTRRLGATGPEVSALGLGCNNFGWRIDAAASQAVVDAALDAGITLFDTADVYGETASEAFLGQALAGRRDEVVLVTKFGLPVPGAPDAAPGSAAYMTWAVEGSLERLRTDAIDVYMYHRPDGITPIEETMAGLADLARQGKIRFAAISNATPQQITEAAAAARTAGIELVAAENRYSLLHREAEAELLPACREAGVGLLPFYPLESGALTGKYRRDEALPAASRFGDPSIWKADQWLTPEVFDRLEAVDAYARERGLAMLDVALGGLLATAGVASVIAGATRAEQIAANARAISWEPDAEDQLALRSITA
ncbi:MAG: aldo/keto reductase [Solirubrobacteraceae bacterium]|nr:aldo/keto reductase [Patulibacter sp.]